VSKAFRGERVELRPKVEDGVWEVWFGRQCLGQLDQRVEVECRLVVRRRITGLGGDVGGSGFVRCAHSAAATHVPEQPQCYPPSRTPVILDSAPNRTEGDKEENCLEDPLGKETPLSGSLQTIETGSDFLIGPTRVQLNVENHRSDRGYLCPKSESLCFGYARRCPRIKRSLPSRCAR